jgi:hypothetical protein
MPDRPSQRFTRLSEQLRVRPLVPADRIRRGERRRRRDAILASIVAAVAIGSVGTLVGLSLTRGSAADSPAGPPPTMAAAFSALFNMPHEGQTGWVRDDNPHAAGALIPCDGPDVTQDHRLAAVTMTGPGMAMEEAHSPTRLTEQVILFDRPETADATVRALANAAQSCGWGGSIRHDTVYGDDVLMAYYRADRGVVGLKLIKDAIVTARGNAVIVMYSEVTGALMSSSDSTAVQIISDRLCATMKLCQVNNCIASMPSPSPPKRTPCPRTSSDVTPSGHGPTGGGPKQSSGPAGPSPSPGPGPHYDPTLPPPT